MLGNGSPYHEDFMSYASESRLKSDSPQSFVEWVCQYLAKQLQPSHVSVLLYDDALESYAVRSSIGRYRIPPKLVRLDPNNCLIRMLEEGEMISPYAYQTKDMVIASEFAMCRDPLSLMILNEMKLHHVEVCVKIKTEEDKPIGYLLIGPQVSGHAYTEDDLTFFKALAEDIAQNIEQRNINTNLSDVSTDAADSIKLSLIKESLRDLSQKIRFEGGELAVARLEIKQQDGMISDNHCENMIKKICQQKHDGTLAIRNDDSIYLLLTMPEKQSKEDPLSFRFRCLQIIGLLLCDIPDDYAAYVGITFISSEMTKSDHEILQETMQALQKAKQMSPRQVAIYSA